MPDLVVSTLPLTLQPDPSRTVIRPFYPEDPPAFAVKDHPRPERIIRRVLELDDDRVAELIASIVEPLRRRHRLADEALIRRYEEVRGPSDADGVSGDRALLIGAYFSQEYAFEAAALFNPSITLHHEQDGLPPGTVRFTLSLRGIGEGHISSVTFRTGTWQVGGTVVVDPPSRHGVPPRIEISGEDEDETAAIAYRSDTGDLSESVLFPVLPSQAKGIEDLRLVRFIDDDGTASILGTYTAFDGQNVRQELFQVGHDYGSVRLRSLRGPHMDSKGMALFPRKVGGRYAAIGRQDNENMWLLTSDDLVNWREGPKILAPQEPWEFVQIGNCGSPIEFDEGWLLLTHGVGMVRNYCMGAVLLDKADPTKVLGRTAMPLLSPREELHGGYVPNVIYSCGALAHDGMLLIPYGVGDHFTAFATVPVVDVLSAMR